MRCEKVDSAAVAADPVELARPDGLTVATAVEYLRLLRSARVSPDRARRYQHERLQEIVSQARSTVPMYREFYASLPSRGTVKLSELPVLEKSDFRARTADQRRAGPPQPLARSLRSSGSSGQPLAVEWGPRFAWWQGVLTLRMAHAQGLRPTHRRAVLVGVPDTRPAGRGPFGVMRGRHLHLHVKDSAESLARALLAVRPDAIFGHGHVLIEVGERLAGSRLPRVVNPAGEQLTPENRATLRRIYGSEPLDVYSTSEHGIVAWQCRAADLYHINYESVCVEVLNDDGMPAPAGASGALVVTGLGNPLMPFLRYRTGDVGVIATRRCRCGWTLPALEQVQGRLMDWLLDDRGRRVPPQRLWLSVHHEDGLSLVHRYQVRQELSRRVDVMLIPQREISPMVLRQLERSYQRTFGSGISVSVRCVEALEDEPSGKFRTVIAAE